MMSNFSNDTQKQKAIGDDNDDNESQHIPRSISDNVDARQLSQLSDMTSPFDASYGNTSRATVNELLATSVENSHKSNGDAQVITAATKNTAAEYTKKENIVIGITNTTGSMGVLRQHQRNNGMEHGYCTDHNLHCNAILAFAAEYQTPH
jgi:hypothetical protein